MNDCSIKITDYSIRVTNCSIRAYRSLKLAQGRIWGRKGAEAPPFYFDPALGHHEPRPSICFKSMQNNFS